ncbi:Carbamoyltransferase HypF [Grimontia celer]|uniref:Carbamoyltransferase HypF n=1 Tax=Grimontia celer TaxID=1796497 RepID=A0A128EXV5_9GAMM|nr:carbamoyltransferase HypF [Grimontia celer]CZF78841.1 Carbamoyltransferase HypF [Grimontia celer]
MTGFRIRIRGVVQGVGFRPTVWRVARGLSLQGHVLNDGEGVIVELWCDETLAIKFVRALELECPPLATITSVDIDSASLTSPPPDSFEIVESHESAQISAGIPVDAAVCPQCIEETLDPSSRRYRYPFTNCTHCGPRLTITKALPYDRPKTSMATFPLCDACEQEYQNPANRRFHAQPVACADCGPTLRLFDENQRKIEPDSIGATDAIEVAASLLKQGKIIAVKGLGGFHLACDATNNDAVSELRRRKKRPAKPFAVMMRDMEQVMTHCLASEEGAQSLRSAASPVVIMPLRNVTTSHHESIGPEISPYVAPDLAELGVMLPSTPLHLLLCRDADIPLVMTSANLSGNPQCTGNDEAFSELEGIADFWLVHNRDIVIRADDSVLRQTELGLQVIRRARGLAPSPIPLPKGFDQAPQVLALGGEVKNAFCLLSGHGAILSQYIGDLESLKVWDDFQYTLAHYQSLYRFKPERIAVDCHPEYIATKFAKSTFDTKALVEVQHHHAHIAACMGENNLPIDHEKVLGVVLDGLGFGSDGTFWGGEFLLADYLGFERIGHLLPVSLPGGNQAIIQPWRNLVAWLNKSNVDEEQKSALFAQLNIDGKDINTLTAMIDNGLNSPRSTSTGRLFDAVSAALSVCIHQQSYEGQAAIELEALANQSTLSEQAGYPFNILCGSSTQMDPSPMWAILLEDLLSGAALSTIAMKFHLGLAEAISKMVVRLSQSLDFPAKVALSGGVFQNKLLLEQTVIRLKQQGVEVLIHQQVPANDGGLAFGQALIAAAVSLSGNTVEQRA